MAVYTRLTKEEISDHLKNYQIGELVDFKEIVAGIDNSNFIIKTTQDSFILTIFEARIKSEELPFFINLKTHLAGKGICCPRPILNNDGQSIADLKGKKSSIVTFLSGAMLEPQEDGYYANITNKHCFEVGKVLAKLHQGALDFDMQRENDLNVHGFVPFFAKFEHLIDGYQSDLKQEIVDELVELKAKWQDDLPSAAVHADLFPDNVFFDEQNNLSGVIDFYFAAQDMFIYDFAIIVNAWCFDENNAFVQDKFDNMLQGYQENREFSDAEIGFLKTALRAASMRFLLTRLHDMFFTPEDSLVKVKDPQEYLQKLRYFRGE